MKQMLEKNTKYIKFSLILSLIIFQFYSWKWLVIWESFKGQKFGQFLDVITYKIYCIVQRKKKLIKIDKRNLSVVLKIGYKKDYNLSICVWVFTQPICVRKK